MSVVDSIGLAAARQLEQRASPAMALRAYRALAGVSGAPSVRAEALLGALRCAISLDDAREIEALAALWSVERATPSGAAVLAHSLALARRGELAPARALAEAEASRHPDARAHYVLARIHELGGDERRALDCHREVAALARPDEALGTTARARLLEAGLARDAPYPALAPLVEALAAVRGLGGVERLLCARARLRSPSKYVRAAGFSTLADLAAEPDRALARAATILAARRADELGRTLSAVEAERIAATLGHWPDAAERARALDALRAHTTAQLAAASSAPESEGGHVGRYAALAAALLAGQPVALDRPEDDTPRRLALAGAGLDALAALALGDAARAARCLERARALAHAALPHPPSVWSAALVALDHTDAGARDAGLRLTERLFARRTSPPPRGLLPYAHALARAGAHDLALEVHRAAVDAEEPGARQALGEALRARGWQRAAEGRAREAVVLLRAAKQLLA